MGEGIWFGNSQALPGKCANNHKFSLKTALLLLTVPHRFQTHHHFQVEKLAHRDLNTFESKARGEAGPEPGSWMTTSRSFAPSVEAKWQMNGAFHGRKGAGEQPWAWSCMVGHVEGRRDRKGDTVWTG